MVVITESVEVSFGLVIFYPNTKSPSDDMIQDLFQPHTQTTMDTRSTGHKRNYSDKSLQDTISNLRKPGEVWTNQQQVGTLTFLQYTIS